MKKGAEGEAALHTWNHLRLSLNSNTTNRSLRECEAAAQSVVYYKSSKDRNERG